MNRFLLSLVALAFLTVGAQAACGGGGSNCFWVGGTGTWDNSTTTHWSGSSGGAGGVGPPAATDTVTLDGSSGGGTVTIAATINGSNTVSSITMDAFTGTLDASANNPNLTMNFFSSNGSSTRTLSMGNGTWTMVGQNSSVWTVFGSNMTLNANSSTLKFSGTPNNNRSTAFGGGMTLTYHNVLVDTDSTGFMLTLAAGNSGSTVASLNLTSPTSVEFLNPWTISNAISWAGSAFNNVLNIKGGGTLTVASGSTVTWAALRLLVFAGVAVSPTNSFDLKGNNMNGGSITGPSGVGGGRIIGG